MIGWDIFLLKLKNMQSLQKYHMLSTLYRSLGTVIVCKLILLLYHLFSSLVCTYMSKLLTMAFNYPKTLKLFYKWDIYVSYIMGTAEMNKYGLPYIAIPLTGITVLYRKEYTWIIPRFEFIFPSLWIIPYTVSTSSDELLTIIYHACDLFVHTPSYKLFISSYAS